MYAVEGAGQKHLVLAHFDIMPSQSQPTIYTFTPLASPSVPLPGLLFYILHWLWSFPTSAGRPSGRLIFYAFDLVSYILTAILSFSV